MLNKMRPKPLQALFAAQFLSAFVDNMILFVVLAIIKRDSYPDYYLPFVQSVFLAAYVLLSPWVGRYADRLPKAKVLITGNLIKLAGVSLLVFDVNPALSYAVVGVGAVVYSPAKYGILPFLTSGEKALLKANSGLESYTILAILLGSVAGGFFADISIGVSLTVCVALYLASVGINVFIPRDRGDDSITYGSAVKDFYGDVKTLLSIRESHYSLAGTGSFWLSSAVLRMLIFAWAPLVLGIADYTSISMIVAASGVGVAVGALAAPRLVSIKTYHKTAWCGLFMGLGILAFCFVKNVYLTVGLLIIIGAFGGIFIVPMNACLQNVGHNTIGAGKTIAVQNFVENIFMFFGVGAYTLAVKAGVEMNTSLAATGFIMLLFTGYLFWQSRKAPFI